MKQLVSSSERMKAGNGQAAARAPRLPGAFGLPVLWLSGGPFQEELLPETDDLGFTLRR